MAVGGGGGGGSAIRAGRAFVELFLNDRLLTRGLRGLQQRFAGFSRSLAVAGGALAGLGGLASFAGLNRVVSTLDDLTRTKAVADAFGITAEAASGLFGVFQRHGSTFKEDVEGITQFSQRISDALSGVGGPTGEAAKLFDGLSISAKDLQGVPLDEAFFRVHEAIRELPQELQASKLALVGGTDSLKLWLPLLSRSTAELRAMSKEMARSDEELQAAKDTTDAYRQATTALSRVWQDVVVIIAPSVGEIARLMTEAGRSASGFVKENQGLITGVAAAAVGVAGLGVALLGLSAVAYGVSVALGALATVVGFLFSPVGLLVAGVAAGVAALFTYTDAWSQLQSAFSDTTADILSGWEAITAALQAGDLAAAWRVAVTGVEVIWARFLLNLRDAWDGFKQFFVGGFRDAVYLIKIAWNDMTAYLATKFVELAEQLHGTGLTADLAALMDPTGTLRDVMIQAGAAAPKHKRAIEADRARVENELARERQGQEEVDAADRRAAEARLAAAQKEFELAKAAAHESARPAAAAAVAKKPTVPEVAAQARQFATLGGSFGSTVGGRQFQRSTEGLQKASLAELKKIAEGIGETVRAVEGLELRWGA